MKSTKSSSVNYRKKKTPIYKCRWNVLTPKQKFLRKISLDVLSQSRQSKKSLSKLAKENGISLKAVINNTNAFRKIKGRWIPKKYDKITRSMIINENGKEVSIEINDSRKAALIGKYHNAVKQFLSIGDDSKLSKFQNKRIKDIDGKWHSFETETKKIIEINEKIEEPEFYEVYAS